MASWGETRSRASRCALGAIVVLVCALGCAESSGYAAVEGGIAPRADAGAIPPPAEDAGLPDAPDLGSSPDEPVISTKPCEVLVDEASGVYAFTTPDQTTRQGAWTSAAEIEATFGAGAFSCEVSGLDLGLIVVAFEGADPNAQVRYQYETAARTSDWLVMTPTIDPQAPELYGRRAFLPTGEQVSRFAIVPQDYASMTLLFVGGEGG